MFECPQCHTFFNAKHHLTYHITHHVCAKKKLCSQCGQNFSSEQRLQYHIKHEVCQRRKLKLQLKTKPKLVLKSKPHIDPDEPNLEIKLAKLEGRLESLERYPRQIIKRQVNNIIVPPAFLQLDNIEMLEKLNPGLINETIQNHTTDFICHLIKETNCNPELPICHSIRVTNSKSKYAQISNGNQYIKVPKKRVIEDLIENKKHIIQSYIDEHGDKYGEKILSRYQRYMDLLDDDTETQKFLEDEIACMLMNISAVIMTDEWSKKLMGQLHMIR